MNTASNPAQMLIDQLISMSINDGISYLDKETLSAHSVHWVKEALALDISTASFVELVHDTAKVERVKVLDTFERVLLSALLASKKNQAPLLHMIWHHIGDSEPTRDRIARSLGYGFDPDRYFDLKAPPERHDPIALLTGIAITCESGNRHKLIQAVGDCCRSSAHPDMVRLIKQINTIMPSITTWIAFRYVVMMEASKPSMYAPAKDEMELLKALHQHASDRKLYSKKRIEYLALDVMNDTSCAGPMTPEKIDFALQCFTAMACDDSDEKNIDTLVESMSFSFRSGAPGLPLLNEESLAPIKYFLKVIDRVLPGSLEAMRERVFNMYPPPEGNTSAPSLEKSALFHMSSARSLNSNQAKLCTAILSEASMTDLLDIAQGDKAAENVIISLKRSSQDLEQMKPEHRRLALEIDLGI